MSKLSDDEALLKSLRLTPEVEQAMSAAAAAAPKRRPKRLSGPFVLAELEPLKAAAKAV